MQKPWESHGTFMEKPFLKKARLQRIGGPFSAHGKPPEAAHVGAPNLCVGRLLMKSEQIPFIVK